jgi:3-polyprenyl-4-hydroxybenzoate decarboxylase
LWRTSKQTGSSDEFALKSIRCSKPGNRATCLRGRAGLLFERPAGAPVLCHEPFGTMDRIQMALGRDPAEIGEELVSLQRLNPPSLGSLWRNRRLSRLVSCVRLPSLRAFARNVESPDHCPVSDTEVLARRRRTLYHFGMVITHPRTREIWVCIDSRCSAMI